ncbi:MAG: hypothetical protein ABI867_15480 [Kofleriaceae bacterium]
MLGPRLLAITLVVFASDAGAGPGAKIQVTIWATPSAAALGGSTYGMAPVTGALVTEQRDIEIGASGDVRIANIAATADPASVQLRDLTEPTLAILEQRFVAGATTPTELIARRIGEQVTVVTAKGDVSGTLRAVDEHSIVLEIGSGDAKRVSIMRRDYVLDVRLPGNALDRPALVMRVATKKPGKHAITLAYRASGITWAADYLAVLDEPGKKIDFTAWALVRNATGATFESADVTLLTGGGAAAVRYALPHPVRLGAGDSVQVELVPALVAVPARAVVTYEAMADPSAQQATANFDCTAGNSSDSGGRAEGVVELDLPQKTPLPDGRVRLFRKRGNRLEVANEDALRPSAGLARIRLSTDTEVTGERHTTACNPDERAHTVSEKVIVKVENKGAQAVEVVVREFMWRWPVWRIDAEDKKGVRSAPQTLEYRVRVPAKGSQSITYSVVYTW